jgi:S-(hydroxymethyl)glutathione dehydrogenase/alcohol dehydrogenase
MCLLGAFAERTVVNEASCIKIEQDIPLEVACLLGCGVVTGWGSSVYAAEVKPGEDVAVIGIGGIGINAVQGARIAGARHIFAIDPVELKREKALQMGATHAFSSVEEAQSQISDITWGRNANKVIMTMGLGQGGMIAQAMGIAAKRGRVVVTNLHAATEAEVGLSALDLTLMEKQLVGSLFGSANPRSDIPRLLDLYRAGQLKLDELVTRTYSLSEINQGYDDMRNGKNLRGVVTSFD